MTFEILKAVKTSTLIFSVVTTCGLLGRYQRFRLTYCPCVQCVPEDKQHFGETYLTAYLKMEAVCFCPKRWYLYKSLTVTTQKTNIDYYKGRFTRFWSGKKCEVNASPKFITGLTFPPSTHLTYRCTPKPIFLFPKIVSDKGEYKILLVITSKSFIFLSPN
jgi:hypothetical protein